MHNNNIGYNPHDTKKLEQLFINIYEGETPFTKENINYIKTLTKLMILAILIPNICGIIMTGIIKQDSKEKMYD